MTKRLRIVSVEARMNLVVDDGEVLAPGAVTFTVGARDWPDVVAIVERKLAEIDPEGAFE